MTDFYADLRSTAGEMLALVANGGFGMVVTVTHASGSSFDDATGINTPTTATETGSGVVVEYPITIRSRGGQTDDKGSLQLTGNKNLLLSPLKSDGTALTKPTAGDTATVGGVAYTITAAEAIAPAGTTIYFDCNVKGAA